MHYGNIFCRYPLRPEENYANLNVDFDLWNGESDVQDTIAPMVQKLKDQGLAYEDQGAVVVDVKEETDTKEVPPCMILKSDGAALYTTTDLATIVERIGKITIRMRSCMW